MTSKEFTWDVSGTPTGEQDRQLQLSRPCTCGCDYRSGIHGVGYLSGSVDGLGFTLWIEDEAVYEVLELVLERDSLARAVRMRNLTMGLEDANGKA